MKENKCVKCNINLRHGEPKKHTGWNLCKSCNDTSSGSSACPRCGWVMELRYGFFGDGGKWEDDKTKKWHRDTANHKSECPFSFCSKECEKEWLEEVANRTKEKTVFFKKDVIGEQQEQEKLSINVDGYDNFQASIDLAFLAKEEGDKISDYSHLFGRSFTDEELKKQENLKEVSSSLTLKHANLVSSMKAMKSSDPGMEIEIINISHDGVNSKSRRSSNSTLSSGTKQRLETKIENLEQKLDEMFELLKKMSIEQHELVAQIVQCPCSK